MPLGIVHIVVRGSVDDDELILRGVCWAWVGDKCGCAYLVGGWLYGRLVHVSSNFGWEGQGRLLTLDRLLNGVVDYGLLVLSYPVNLSSIASRPQYQHGGVGLHA